MYLFVSQMIRFRAKKLLQRHPASGTVKFAILYFRFVPSAQLSLQEVVRWPFHCVVDSQSIRHGT